MNVEALHTKYPILDWEIYTEGARKYWKIIRVGNHSDVYQFFDDMLKAFDREDLVKLWSLVKEKFTSTKPTEDKEREIWVELKRLFEPNTDDEFWKLPKHIHDEEMDLETAQITTTTKLPTLKQGDYDMWRLKIEQYFQVQDYALWDIIENGNSFKFAAKTTTNVDGTSTTLIPGPVTIEEKYKDAKTLFAAIQTRFGGNEATKKTQKTLLKQMYEKVLQAHSLLTLFLTGFRRLNKPDIDTMSFDDLYNNFKNVEQEVKGTASSSSSLSSQNMSFVSSPSSTNEVNTAYEVSTANTQDLEQIHEDDIEEMDLKWQLALLSMRTRRFFQKTGRKITINGSDTAGYDKSKVECFNCHKMGHFARECRGPRNQDNRNRNQDSSRRTVNVEEISSKAMLAIDGAGFDWSYMADDEVPTNMALMAFSDSEVHNDKTCSKTCLKSFETLKTQLDDLRIEFNKSEFNLANYKRGLASVEEQLVFYKKNEVIFCEQLVVLKRDISYKDSEISMLKSELEKLKQEKESNQLKIENFDNASKRLFSPLNLDLSNSSLEKFQQPEFKGYGPKTSKNVCEDTSNKVMESPDAPMVKELVLDDKLENKTIFPTIAKIEFVRPKQQEKPVRKPIKYAEMHRSQGPRGNQRNWNNHKSQQLGSDFVVYNKACFVCGSFDQTIKEKRWPKAVNTDRPKVVNTVRPNSTVVNADKANQISRNLIEDMLPLGEEQMVAKLL
ncbi:ribonuclease H-like domain-containing protein, partial [Tanacetum coccineum]